MIFIFDFFNELLYLENCDKLVESLCEIIFICLFKFVIFLLNLELFKLIFMIILFIGLGI